MILRIFSVAGADIQRTALITPLGLYEFVRIPFGLKNMVQTFQKFIARIYVSPSVTIEGWNSHRVCVSVSHEFSMFSPN